MQQRTKEYLAQLDQVSSQLQDLQRQKRILDEAVFQSLLGEFTSPVYCAKRTGRHLPSHANLCYWGTKTIGYYIKESDAIKALLEESSRHAWKGASFLVTPVRIEGMARDLGSNALRTLLEKGEFKPESR
jgi:hypothetical protein